MKKNKFNFDSTDWNHIAFSGRKNKCSLQKAGHGRFIFSWPCLPRTPSHTAFAVAQFKCEYYIASVARRSTSCAGLATGACLTPKFFLASENAIRLP